MIGNKKKYALALMLYSIAILMPVSAAGVLENHFTFESFEEGFYSHLLQHEDTALQAYGVMYWGRRSDLGKKKIEQVNKRISDLLKNDSLIGESLRFLQNICTLKNKIFSACDSALIVEKRLNSHPEDVSVYLGPLENAVKSGRAQEAMALVQQMAEVKYLRLYMHYSEIFEEAFDSYMLGLTLDDLVLDGHLEKYLQFMHSEEKLTKNEIDLIKKQMQAYLIHINKMYTNFLFPLPSFNGLTQACSTYQELKEVCLTISKVMFDTSDEVIGKMVGLSIPVNVYELSGETKKSAQALARNKAFKASYYCLKQPEVFPAILDQSYLILGQVLKVRERHGEWKALQLQAKLMYLKALREEKEGAEMYNPKRCFIDNDSEEFQQ